MQYVQIIKCNGTSGTYCVQENCNCLILNQTITLLEECDIMEMEQNAYGSVTSSLTFCHSLFYNNVICMMAQHKRIGQSDYAVPNFYLRL